MKGTDCFGYPAKDKITGFAGVVIGYCQYSTGCHQLLLSPPVKDGQYQEARWFDEQRIELTSGEQAISFDNGDNPGCDKPAPVR